MKHIELHIIETARDVETACLTGLLERDEVDGSLCEGCDESIGITNGAFVGFALVLDETDYSWFVCLDCVSVVLRDESKETDLLYGTMFDADDEYENFTLDADERD